MEKEKQPYPVVLIFKDGSVEIVGRVSVGAVRAAIQQLDQALNNVHVGPLPPAVEEESVD